MATKKSLKDLDLGSMMAPIQDQFRNLNPNDPSVWPPVPRYALMAVVAVACFAVGWFLVLTGADDELKSEQTKELSLRDDYKKKLSQAVNLEALKKQREQVQQYVTQLEKQLPSKAEMDALLSDINQAGLGRSLQFDWFKPGQVSVKEYYAELPISIRVTGRYHDMGSFASDIANLSRIVTLNNLSISAPKDGGSLSMDATAKTFRYLDADEVQAQRKAAAGAKK